MSTSGSYGFRINGQDKLFYNHWDSYPDGLGFKVLDFIRTTSYDEMREIAERIQLVDDSTPPTQEQIEICRKAGTINLNVGDQSETDWYCLLRNAQGKLSFYKSGFPFLLGTERCEDEWTYIIDLDNETFDVYSENRLVYRITIEEARSISNPIFVSRCGD